MGLRHMHSACCRDQSWQGEKEVEVCTCFARSVTTPDQGHDVHPQSCTLNLNATALYVILSYCMLTGADNMPVANAELL